MPERDEQHYSSLSHEDRSKEAADTRTNEQNLSRNENQARDTYYVSETNIYYIDR